MRKGFYYSLVVLLIFICASPVSAEDGLPYVEPVACPIEVPANAEIECGTLVTPENYAKPDGAVVRLPYIYIHSTSPHPESTPMVFTEGGPGLSSLRQVWGFASSRYIEDRDVIIFEQRGNRYAQPALMCDYADIANFDQSSTPCLDQILARGVDITQYTTAVIAEDIEALRIALNIDQWNLYGTSYSTRLMQVLMAKHPEGIRSVILQSVNPLHDTRYEHDPEHSTRALSVMFSDCAADPACAAGYPDLEAKFAEAVAMLNEDPVELEFANPETGEQFPYTVDGSTFIGWMVGDAFYGPAYPRYTTAYLPLLIQTASQRNITILRKWAAWNLEKDVFLSDDFSYGVYFGVNCQDDIRQMTQAQYQAQSAAYPELDGFIRHWEEFQVCELWGLPQAPLLAVEPVKSDIPTLVLAGRYDPITPPEWAQQVASNLTNAFYVEFPSQGHSLDAVSSCPEAIKVSFLRDPLEEPDTSCVADEPAVKYILPSEMFIIPGFAQSLEDIELGNPEKGNPAFEVIAGIALLICIFVIFLTIILQLMVRFPRKDQKEKMERFNYLPMLIAGMAALLSVTVVIVMSLVNQAEFPLQKLDLIFGLPANYPWVQILGILVYIQILITILLVVVTVRTWVKKLGSVFTRVVLILTALAAISFWPFYLRWDLTSILIQMLIH